MNKLDNLFAIGLIALAGSAFAALPGMAADMTTPPSTPSSSSAQPQASTPSKPAMDTTAPAASSDIKSGTDKSDKSASEMKSTATKPVKAAAKKPAMSPRRVEEIQAALQGAGVKVDTDGIWGPKTTAAVKAFQKDHNLKVTGHLDRATMAKLNVQRWT